MSADSPPPVPEPRYWAFISYGHADEAWARWLHRALETYKVPRALVGTTAPDGATVRPSRLFPVFRDRDELASADSLSTQIEGALHQSRNLVVICSPNAARSRWVNEEVRSFKALGRAHRVFSLIVSGEPYASEKPGGEGECFPEALRFQVGADGRITGERAEPLAADAREVGDGKRNALIKLVAGLLEVGFDSLKQREQERRVRRLALVGAVLTAAVVVLSGLSLYAFRQKREAEKQAREARAALSGLLATQADLAGQSSPPRSLLLAVEALSVTENKHEPHVADAEVALRQALLDAGGRPFGAHAKPVEAVALSADGRWLVTAAEDEDARLWDTRADDRRGIALAGARAPVAISPSGRRLVTGGREGEPARLWDLTRPDPGTGARTLEGAGGPLAFSNDERWLVTGGLDLSVRVWDLTEAVAPRVLPAETSKETVVALSPDNRWLATSSWTSDAHMAPVGLARLWDLTAEHPEAAPFELTGHDSSVSNLVFSPDSRSLVTSSAEYDAHRFRFDKDVRVWDLDRRGEPRVLHGHQERILAMAISRDGRRLVTGSADKTARVWDLSAADPGARPLVLAGHENGVGGVAIGPDSRWVATISDQQDWRSASKPTSTVRFWDLSAADPSATPLGLEDGGRVVEAVASALSPDGRWLLIGGTGGGAYVLDLAAAPPTRSSRVLRGHEGKITTAVFRPDGRGVVTGSADGSARLWALSGPSLSASPLTVRGEHDEAFRVSPDGRWLLTVGADDPTAGGEGVAVLRDLTAPDPSAGSFLKGHEGPLFDIAFSENGRWVATAGHDQTARVWPFTPNGHGPTPFVLRGHTGPVSALVFTRDGRRVATGSFDGTVRLWDLTRPDPSADPVVLSAGGAVFRLAIGSDGRWLASSGAAPTPVALWDLSASAPAPSARTLPNGGEARLSPDGRWLVTYGLDERRAIEERMRTTRDPHEQQELQKRLSGLSGVTAVWDLQAADPVATRQILDKAGAPVEFSPDGRWLLTKGAKNVARLWPLRGDRAGPPLELTGHENEVGAAAFDPAGHWLVTGSYDDTARLWRLEGAGLGGPGRVLYKHEGACLTVALSRDGRRLLTASDRKGDARLFTVEGGEPLDEPSALPGVEVGDGAFSIDGRWLIARSHETRSVALWPLDLRELMALGCRTAGRTLTRAEWEQYFRRQAFAPFCSPPK